MACARGVTLLELLTVLVIMAIMLGMTRLALDGVSSAWRLRAAAHEVENAVRYAQNAAASRGRPAQVLYDVADGSFWVRLDDDDTHGFRRLESGMRFDVVRFGTGRDVRNEVAAATAWPDGTIDSHEVVLVNAEQARVRIAFARLTGEMTYREGGDASLLR